MSGSKDVKRFQGRSGCLSSGSIRVDGYGRRAITLLVVALLSAKITCTAAVAQGFVDPLDSAAEHYKGSVEKLPIEAMVNTGSRMIAVGMRGVILSSDDGGEHWQQSAVPVGSDLLDVSFVSPQLGWVVGQDGVVLATHDGGATWQRQWDGRQAGQFSYYYRNDKGLDANKREDYLRQLDQNFKAGPVLPFFGVYFSDPHNGLAIGPFGTLIASEDGGEHWRPALHQIDNPDALNLNAIAQVNGSLFITSEQGVVFKADAVQRQFHPVATGHEGSFYSIAGHDNVIVVGGLGGVIYASPDLGETWVAVANPLTQLVTRLTFDSRMQRFVAVTSGGEVLTLSADGRQSALSKPQSPMFYTGVAAVSGNTIYAGIQGLRRDIPLTSQAPRGEQ